MLNKLKPARNDEKPKYSYQQRRLTGYDQRYFEMPVSVNHQLKNRITELEEEIARLRSTIKCFQELCLMDD